MPEDDATQLAVVAARLTDLRADVRALRTEVQAAQTTAVGRGEWMQRNAAVDARFEGQGREISDLKAARAPWWSKASVVLAAAAIGWSIFGPVITAR